MRAALLLIDLQQDFLQRPGLSPSAAEVVAANAELLALARQAGFPVIHIRTVVEQDGRDAMPHWQELGVAWCRRGTPGVLEPRVLQPLPGEHTVEKRFYSGFDSPRLEPILQQLAVDTLLLGGLYLHACIRATAQDGYARGYRVDIVEEAVASTAPLHAELSRQWLEGRAARFVPLDVVRERVLPAASAAPPPGTRTDGDPAAVLRTLRDAAARARLPARADWTRLLQRWAEQLEGLRDDFAQTMVREIGKPIRDAQEEFTRALEHLRAVVELANEPDPAWPGVSVRYRPQGTVLLLTPWNNPLAIPLSKIAAALAFGNQVAWKPSPLAPAVSALLLASYRSAGLPAEALQLVSGGPALARALLASGMVDAVSLTGSVATGRAVSALCTLHDKPLQAELGGNNALLVLAGADLEHKADGLARAAFSFSGQRCTAIRRFVVERPLAQRFEAALKAAVAALPLGDPGDPATVLGPLVSASRVEATDRAVQEALAAGARLVCGGARPEAWRHGHWYAATLLADVEPDAAVAQQETFGPLAVIQVADDLEHALQLCNGVEQGLVAGLVGGDLAARARFAEAAQAGILRFGDGPLPVHPMAPFGGWKASHIGPPEHGSWDRVFYARPQAIYQGDAG